MSLTLRLTRGWAFTFVLGVVLAFTTESAVARAGDGYLRQPGVDAVEYTFGLLLRDDTDRITGRAEVEIKFTLDGLTQFALDLATPVNGWGMRVTEVTRGEKIIRFKQRDDRLILGPFAATTQGEHRRYVIQYEGVPRGGLRIGPNRYGERTFFSSNWPDKAREWLPVIDHPSDKARSEFLIDAPNRYRVVANGRLQSETELRGGRRRTHWRSSVPIATWLNAVAVARFAAHDAGTVAGVPLSVWVYPQDFDAGVAALVGPARQSVDFFSKLSGPIRTKKSAWCRRRGSPGDGHASAIFLGESDVPVRRPSLVAHEIAHQWFGDSVTERDWDDLWLSEGFATYFALLFTEAHEGQAAFRRGVMTGFQTVRAIEAASPGCRSHAPATRSTGATRASSYIKKGRGCCTCSGGLSARTRFAPASARTTRNFAMATPRPRISGT